MSGRLPAEAPAMSDLQLVHWWRDLWTDLGDLNSQLEQSAQRLGIDASVVDLLCSLRFAADHRLCMKQLCIQLRCSTSGMTKMVDRAQRVALVARVRPAGDRRLVHVELTDNGLAQVERLLAAHAEHLRRSLPSTARVRAITTLRSVKTETHPDMRRTG